MIPSGHKHKQALAAAVEWLFILETSIGGFHLQLQYIEFVDLLQVVTITKDNSVKLYTQTVIYNSLFRNFFCLIPEIVNL